MVSKNCEYTHDFGLLGSKSVWKLPKISVNLQKWQSEFPKIFGNCQNICEFTKNDIVNFQTFLDISKLIGC